MTVDVTGSATAPPPIEDYALLSDMRTAALVDTSGSVDWMCLPRFDSPAVFARLLGDEEHGRWQITPTTSDYRVERAYRDNTMVLDTVFHTASGSVRLTDSMLPHQEDADDSPALLRSVTGLSGTVELRLRWVLRPSYGVSTPWVRRRYDEDAECILALAGPTTVTLHGDPLPHGVRDEHKHEVVFTVGEGEHHSWVMAYRHAPDETITVPDPDEELAGAERFWRRWASQIDYAGPHAQAIHRSLAVLKGLTYAPTGGIVAAPTTSLPEAWGGERNWDYRYCWLRDATMTLLAFDNFGCLDEAKAWRRWLLRAVAGDPADAQIMYGIDGSRHLHEWEVERLPGYHGARPVRVGNAAYQQLQLDVYGEVLEALHLARERGVPENSHAWSLQRGLVRHLETLWNQPDNGLWEVRGEPRYFTYSRAMMWVAFDRAVRTVERHGLDGPVEKWRSRRDELREEVLQRGFNRELGAFTQYYGGTELDAATLRLPAVGLIAGDDKRMLGTLEAIGRELKNGDLVERYNTGDEKSNVDGMPEREGAFLMCSFWYVEALALAGRRTEAEAMFDRLLQLRNDVGLLSEEYDPTTDHFLGNFPQAFSHLALVNTAAVLYGGDHHTQER